MAGGASKAETNDLIRKWEFGVRNYELVKLARILNKAPVTPHS